MKVLNKILIEELIGHTQTVMQAAQQFQHFSLEKLNWKANPEKWSVLECLEHLNRYGDFYLPEITHRLQTAPKSRTSDMFKSGWLGNYFAESMLPKEQLNKMNTFKSMNPLGSALDITTIDKFIAQQQQMLKLLAQARHIDLTKTKTAISISKWIKLRLGDTFRVVIYHNLRHLAQAQQVIENYKTVNQYSVT